ncbi:hypothetical protein B7494_g7424 [Chlorociboria aeruginascens]|nr:hypothetical protein B7494_g7424 [Chlorociboria aeruginascens]
MPTNNTRATTPRLPSPAPGSTLSSNLSFRTAKTSLSPSTSNPTSYQPISQKNFGYLLRPEIYHPLTHLDIPPPFRTPAAQPNDSTPLDTLLQTGHFRSSAIKAASLLTDPTLSPSDHVTIFSLLYTRLSSLTLCNQTSLAAQEVKALEDLNAPYYQDDVTGEHLVPWELRVLAVRLQGMGFNDARRGVMGYYDLAREARLKLSSLKPLRAPRQHEHQKYDLEQEVKISEVESEISLWTLRLSDLGIRVASVLIEMEDLEGAVKFLETLSPSPSSPQPVDPTISTRKALLWLCIGDIVAAQSCFSGSSMQTIDPKSSPSPSPNNKKDETSQKVILALCHIANSSFAAAAEIWEGLIANHERENGNENANANSGELAMWKQNLGVCYLYMGDLEAARQMLESLIDAKSSFHALTFNLSTVYELCTERSRALKIELAERVAGMRGLGSEAGGEGWEKVNGDFKL